MVLDNEIFQKVLMRTYNRADSLVENGNEVIDQSIADKGIVVTYHDSQYKKKVKLIVNTSLILDFETLVPDKLIHKLKKRISEYFHSEYQLEDFTLSGMIFMSDQRRQPRTGIRIHKSPAKNRQGKGFFSIKF